MVQYPIMEKSTACAVVLRKPIPGGIQMKDKRYRKFYLCSLAAIVAVSAYPIYMGIVAVVETLQNGAIPLERYPK